jgi:hypothetical protein
VNINGTLDLTGASIANPVIFKVTSLKGNGNGTELGAPDNFNPPATAPFPIVFQIGTITNIQLSGSLNISDVFTFDLTDFKYSDGTSAANAELWSIGWNAGALTVTAVPEPSTYGFGIGALALAVAAIRRRRKKAGEAKPDEA